MPSRFPVVAALLLAAAPAPGQAQQGQAKLLQDTARFRGATWELVQLVRLDSSETGDTLAVSDIRRVFWLGPRRFIYEAQLTKEKKWALFGSVDGSVRRLAVSGEWFTGPGGVRTRILWSDDYRASAIHAGPASLVTGGTINNGLPNSLFTTDGTDWRRIAGLRDDTIKLGEIVAPSAGCSASAVAFEADGAILLRCFAKQPNLYGVYRFLNGRFEPVFTSTETLAAVGTLAASWYEGSEWEKAGIVRLREFIAVNGGWLAVVRVDREAKKYQDYILTRTSTGPPRELWRTELFSRSSDGIGFTAVSPVGAVVVELGGSIGVVDTSGTWRPLLTASDIKPPKDGGHALLDVTWLDRQSSRALLSVSPYKWEGYRSWALWPKLYYFDGERATELQTEASGLSGAFSNLAPQPVARSVPGYDEGVIVQHPLLVGAKSVAAYFDPDRAAFVPPPAFRTQSGDVGVERLVGWNSPTEAVVRWNGIAVLRRP